MTSQTILDATFDLGSADILTFYREQEVWWVLLPLGIPAVANMVLVSAVTVPLRRRLNGKTGSPSAGLLDIEGRFLLTSVGLSLDSIPERQDLNGLLVFDRTPDELLHRDLASPIAYQ